MSTQARWFIGSIGLRRPEESLPDTGSEKTMSSAKKTEANRRNAQKSSGPKSAEGKSRSRCNAIKHGMRATLAVLPGEDEAAFSSRVDGWTRDLKPRNEAEQYLVDRAARVSWQLDRVERGYVARLTANINNATAAAAAGVTQTEGDDVCLLGARLFWDARGPMPLYPHRPCSSDDPMARVSWPGIAHDPNLPAHLVRSLESTAEGCAWLLDRWAELCSLLEQGIAWQSPDKLKAIRLLGRQPIDAFDVPQVGLVFLACHMIDPSGGEPFHEIWRELKHSEIDIAKQRLRARPMDSLRPNSVDLARDALYGIVDQAVERLKKIAEAYRTRDEANAKLTADLLGFDDSTEGERIRRYETACSRNLIRTLDAFDKRHRAEDDIDPVFPASIDEIAPVSAVEVELEAGPDVEFDPCFVAESTNEPIHLSAVIAHDAVSQPAETSDAGMQSHHKPDAIPKKQELPNEPTVLTGAHDIAELPNEPTALSGAYAIAELPNEPTVLTGAHANPELPNEPTVLTGRQDIAKLPNEPTVLTGAHTVAELPNEPTALLSLQQSGGRKLFASGTHRRVWDAKPKAGPNRKERRARAARSQKTKSDLTWVLPPGNVLLGKPPP
jgi:hypothetical protein